MTVAGIMIVLNFTVFAILISIYFLALLITRIASVSSLVVTGLLPIVNAIVQILGKKVWLGSTVYFAIIAIIIFYAHRDNIKRLREGTEKKLVVQKNRKNDLS